MINWALRYQTIVQRLDQIQPARVLDVGSGPEGLSMFWHGCVVGVDWAFKRRPLHTGIQASALALPFRDQAFPAVVSSDVLEHIQPDLRHNAIMECQRVCQTDLLLTFPSGLAAEQAYRWLARRVQPQPVWLQEHLKNGLPDANRVADWLQALGWQVEMLWSEDAMMHVRLVRWEETAIGKLIDYSLSRLFGRWFAPRLPMPRGVPLRVFIHARR
jgi:hypothetical protein